jgi:ABC-type transport system involved in multi-copper enzyme maturation permease subunit
MYLQLIFAWGLVTALFVILLLSPMASPGFIHSSTGGVGNLLATAMLAAVAFYAAAGITRERERQTLDSLLSLPVDRAEILRAKWLGAILVVRPLGWCMAIIWGMGLIFGGLQPLALPGLVLAWCVYAAFLASLGQWFSLRRQTIMQAMLWTGGTLLVLVLACSLLSTAWRLLILWLPSGVVVELVRISDAGLLPWDAFSTLAFGYDYLLGQAGAGKNIRAVLVGLLIYAAAAAGLWWANKRRFRQLS